MSTEQVSNSELTIQALAAATLTCAVLLVYAILFKGGGSYVYLGWNLFLAGLPLLFAWLLLLLLRRRHWSSWSGIALSALWLGFLPNSFYMITDYIHLAEVRTQDLLFYVVLFTAFIATSLLFGFISLYLVHRQLKRRLPAASVIRCILGILLLCSFAIYLGRDLRWNTWDLLLNPGGILVDVSERFLSPADYSSVFGIIAIFMALLSTMYFVIWRIAQAFMTTATPVRSVILEANERSTHSGYRRRR